MKREGPEELALRVGLDESAAERIERLLAALTAEERPPTKISEPEEALDAHVADGLSGLEVEELRRAGRIADLGAGAGFPGLALAIALPEAQIDLVESGARKGAVIERLGAAAGLPNARVVNERVEDWGAGDGREAYDAVTARALGPLALLVEYAAPLLRPQAVLVAWKGARDRIEEAAGAVAADEVGMALERVLPVRPFAAARERHLHVYRKVGPTPERYPRRAGMAAKRPLGTEGSARTSRIGRYAA